MDFKNPRRGAAGISIIWMVSVLVLFFVAVGIAFVANDEAAQFEASAAQERSEKEVAQVQVADETKKVIAISEFLGYSAPEAVTAFSNLESATSALDNFKNSFPGMDPTRKTVEDCLPVAIADYNAQLERVRTLESEIQRLQGEVSARDTQISSLTSSKDDEIDSLRTQLGDVQSASDDRIASLESQVADLRGQVGDKDRMVKEEQSKFEELERQAEEAATRATSQLTAAFEKLKFLDEPQAVDGEVLAVSADLSVGWINLGNKNRLARGTKFSVVDGTPGVDKIKAQCNVLRVKDNMAQVAFTDIVDDFAPPVAGDVIYNPIYDPKSTRYAVLIGRFSGAYNENELKALLAELNITVQDTLDKTTDYAIIGGEVFYDEEGEALEEPRQPSELPAYKDAVAAGKQIVPLKDIRAYFSPR